MSQENVEAMRRLYDAWNRGDLDEVLASTDEDVELVSLLAAVAEAYQGHEGVRRWWENLHEVFPDWHAEPVEIRDCGDATVTTVHLRGHGGGSGVPIDQTVWHVVHWRTGRIVRLSSHADEADALETVGLSE